MSPPFLLTAAHVRGRLPSAVRLPGGHFRRGAFSRTNTPWCCWNRIHYCRSRTVHAGAPVALSFENSRVVCSFEGPNITFLLFPQDAIGSARLEPMDSGVDPGYSQGNGGIIGRDGHVISNPLVAPSGH